MNFKIDICDDNTNRASFVATEKESIYSLVSYVAAATGVQNYERFKKDGAVIVSDEDGKEIGRADSSTGWELKFS